MNAKKLIIKALTVREPITLATLRMQLNAKGLAIKPRELRQTIAQIEREGYLHIADHRGHKLATSAKEYHAYMDYVNKYLKSFARKKRTAQKNWLRYSAQLFKK